MEEFLICINKKQQLEFLTEEKELVKKLPRSADNYGITENNLTIVRNGWGYTNLQIECEGEFVFTEKENITDDDFWETVAACRSTSTAACADLAKISVKSTYIMLILHWRSRSWYSWETV